MTTEITAIADSLNKTTVLSNSANGDGVGSLANSAQDVADQDQTASSPSTCSPPSQSILDAIANTSDTPQVTDGGNDDIADDNDEISIEDDATDNTTFYSDAQSYWDSVEPTVDGMLGGFSQINAVDIRGSLAYLQATFRTMKPPPRRRRALDCGAGIGRVTRFLLLPMFDRVDAVEQCARFASEMPAYIAAGGAASASKLGTVHNCGLQDFTPDASGYDVIWTQWVLGHLIDADLVAFFRRCAGGLAKSGILVMKENVTSSGVIEKDANDSSMTRPLNELKRLLTLGGMRIVRLQLQNNFPAGIYPVYMITARPVVQANREV